MGTPDLDSPDDGGDAMNERAPEATTAAALERLVELAAPLLADYRREQRADRTWAWLKRAVILTVGTVMAWLWISTWGGLYGLRPGATPRSVALIPIAGVIDERALTSARQLVPLIESSCADDNIEAVVLLITSPGGSPSQAERIGRAVDRCRAKGKRVDAAIEGVGASAAYLIALHADRIVADPYAMVGSIGAVMSRLDASRALAELGISDRTYASGEFKAMLSPFRADTKAQAGLAQGLVDRVAASFADTVRERRGEKLTLGDELASGRLWIADDAHSHGLIDEVLVLEELLARDYADRAVHQVHPQRTLRERLEAGTWVREILAEVDAWHVR